MVKRFPGYKVENLVNLCSFAMGKTPSDLAVSLFGWCRVIFIMNLALHLCYLAQHNPDGLTWIGENLFSPLLFIGAFQANWMVIRHYYPRDFLRPILTMVWIALAVTVISGQLTTMVVIRKDPTYEIVQSTVANLSLFYIYVSYHLREIAVFSQKDDERVSTQGAMPTVRFFLCAPIFIYATVSSLLFFWILYKNISYYHGSLNPVSAVITGALGLGDLLLALAALSLSCVPRPPSAKRKKSESWFDQTIFKNA